MLTTLSGFGKGSINGRILVVKFLESQKLYADFQLHRGAVPLTLVLSRGQLYLQQIPDSRLDGEEVEYSFLLPVPWS